MGSSFTRSPFAVAATLALALILAVCFTQNYRSCYVLAAALLSNPLGAAEQV